MFRGGNTLFKSEVSCDDCDGLVGEYLYTCACVSVGICHHKSSQALGHHILYLAVD